MASSCGIDDRTRELEEEVLIMWAVVRGLLADLRDRDVITRTSVLLCAARELDRREEDADRRVHIVVGGDQTSIRTDTETREGGLG